MTRQPGSATETSPRLRSGDSAHLAQVAEAFSRKAPDYDAFGDNHPNLLRLRRLVYEEVEGRLQPGARLLELNAGTGIDALHFAQRGYRVHATDLAPGMVARIEAKIAASGLQARLTAQQCSFTDLMRVSGGPYDAVLSNFGGLNCVSDLRPIAWQLPPLLRIGAFFTLVVMPPLCPWEWLAALRGDLRTAVRRLTPGGTMAQVEGVRFQTTYYWPGQVRRAFAPQFELIHQQGLSVFAPPADHKAFASRRPQLYRRLVALDTSLSERPLFRSLGDFTLLTFRFRGTG